MNTEPSFLYFAHLMGRPVLDSHNHRVGQFWDLTINPQEPYPPATALILSRGSLHKSFAEVPWDKVDLEDTTFRLKLSEADLVFKPRLEADSYRVRKDILDQQLVDIYNHKVVRVNDVHFLYVRPFLRTVHVDIGSHGLLRRLGWEKPVNTLIRWIRPQAAFLNNPGLMSWKYVKTVSLDPLEPIQMDLTAKQLATIPPADLGEIMMGLDMHQRVALLRTAAPDLRARLFERLDFPQQEQLLEQLDTREGVELLSKMSADEAVDLLGEIPKEQSRQLLSLMESSRSKKLSLLLGYEQDEAGGIMTTELLQIPKNLSVEQTLALIKEKTPELETIYYLYVVDETKKLIGTTTLRRLIAADPATVVENTVFPKPLFVYLKTSLKEVAFLMDKYKVSALPVVNKEKHLQGIITVDDVLHHVIPIAWRRRAGRKRP